MRHSQPRASPEIRDTINAVIGDNELQGKENKLWVFSSEGRSKSPMIVFRSYYSPENFTDTVYDGETNVCAANNPPTLDRVAYSLGKRLQISLP
jgi:hypothetical protein